MINYFKELSDFGLFVLIWLVQLIIYPSFTYMSDDKLLNWHSKYTKLITFVVLPLMVTQLSSTFYLTYADFNYILLTQSILIFLLWTVTFLQAVPLHNKIDKGSSIKQAAIDLVKANRIRTLMWTFIVMLNFINNLFTTY